MRWLAHIICGLLAGGATLLGEPPKVVCSFSIPADWARTLAGSDVSVVALAGPNTDLHSYQPSPADVHQLTQADLIVGIDPAVEPWLQQIVKSNNLTDKVLWIGITWVSDAGTPPCPCGDPKHVHSQPAKLAGDDPHVWMDTSLVEKMVGLLGARMSQLPGLSKTAIGRLETRQAAYVQAIRQVDREAADLFGAIPRERRLIVTHHGNLGRFAKRYGIEVVGVVLQASTTEAADPSARSLAKLAEIVRARNVRVLVHDRGQRAPAAFALARETGLEPPLELSIDSLDRPGMPAGDWVGMLRENARSLAEAMNRR